MISLHEAIRTIQNELIESEQERIQNGVPALFKTEKLTVELVCTFSETDNVKTGAKANVLSVISLGGSMNRSASLENTQKITLEFSVTDLDKNNCKMPEHGNTGGHHPHDDNKNSID